MKRYQLNIFATKSDLERLLRAVEVKQELQFVKAGLFDDPVLDRVPTLINNANLGVAVRGDAAHETRYLVADRNAIIEFETIPQHGGGTKYAVGSQKINPKTMIFWPGGVFENGYVIAGSVGTISEAKESLSLFQLFHKEIKHQFDKIKSFYVGKEAGSLLDMGWRLTSSAASPAIYDLKRQ